MHPAVGQAHGLTSTPGYKSPISMAPWFKPKVSASVLRLDELADSHMPVPVPMSRILCTLPISRGARKSLSPTALTFMICVKCRRSSSRCRDQRVSTYSEGYEASSPVRAACIVVGHEICFIRLAWVGIDEEDFPLGRMMDSPPALYAWKRRPCWMG